MGASEEGVFLWERSASGPRVTAPQRTPQGPLVCPSTGQSELGEQEGPLVRASFKERARERTLRSSRNFTLWKSKTVQAHQPSVSPEALPKPTQVLWQSQAPHSTRPRCTTEPPRQTTSQPPPTQIRKAGLVFSLYTPCSSPTTKSNSAHLGLGHLP